MIRTLVVDYSKFMRTLVADMLVSDPMIDVIATTKDGEDGVAKARLHHPDVITLDVEMPRMDGLEAIKEHGGKTIVSDKETSLIFGMPKAAIDLGCADRIAPLPTIPEEIEKMLRD